MNRTTYELWVRLPNGEGVMERRGDDLGYLEVDGRNGIATNTYESWFIIERTEIVQVTFAMASTSWDVAA